MSAPVVAALASSDSLRTVVELRVGRCGLDADALAALATGERLAGLRCIDRRRSKIAPDRDGAFRAFAAATPELRALELMSVKLAPSAVAVLADPVIWPRLEELSLQSTSLDDAAVEALLAHPRRLRALNLKSNKLGARAGTLLAERAPKSLELLNLEATGLTAAATAAIAAARPKTVVTAGAKASSMYTQPQNDKHGLWLGSTVYRAQDVVGASARRR